MDARVDYPYYIERFGLYPPDIARARDVHVTYVDISVAGITITVYDQSGATARKTLPNMRVIFTNIREDATPP